MISEAEVAVARSDMRLTRALERLGVLADDRDRAAVTELSDRFRGRRLRVLFVGEAKRGKSTLINALLGRQLLPTGVVPLTAVTTTVAFGDDEQVEAAFTDGRHEVLPLAALNELVSERANPQNRRGVAAVTCRLPAQLLLGGVELVDTPGVGSVYEHNTAQATEALNGMDVAIFVVSADPAISAQEREWLRQVRSQAARVFVVLNKADYLSVSDLDEAVEFTRGIVAGELGRDVEVFPVSARWALAAEGDPQSGDILWRNFCATFLLYLQDGGGFDLATSVTTRAARIAIALAEEQEAALAAQSLSEKQLQERLSTFTAEFDAVEASRFEASAFAAATFQRLLQQTADLGRQVVATGSPCVQSAALREFDTAPGPLRNMEAAGLAAATTQIRGLVDDWRATQARYLEAELSNLDANLCARVDEHVRRVRAAAASLFELDLSPLSGDEPLIKRSKFSYAFGPDIGQTEAFATTVRSHLPGQLGRRRVKQYLIERSASLLDQQTGRAVADFTEQLREARRRLQGTIDRRFDAGAGRIAEAVTRTAQARHEASTDLQELRASALQRRDAARELAADFQAILEAQVSSESARD